MRRVFWLLLITAFVGSPAEEPRWMSYEDAVRAARASHESVLVLYGRDSCPYSAPARRAFDATTVLDLTNGRFILAYVDLGSRAGEVVAKRNHVNSTPKLQVLGMDATELWRLTSPDDPNELVAALQEVLDGKTYESQERLLRAGSLGPRQTLTLATTYLERGWARKGSALLREILRDPSRFDRDTRREASLARAEFSTRKQRLKQLPRHLAEFPDDLIARINYAYALRDESLDKRRIVVREVADGIREKTDPRIQLAAYRLIAQFALYSDPVSASWALPAARKRLELAPGDLDNLSELVSLAVLAGRRSEIGDAEQLALANDPQAAGKIAAAIAAGLQQAETLLSSGSPARQR